MNKRLFGMAGNIPGGYRDKRTPKMKERTVRRDKKRRENSESNKTIR